MGLQKTPRLLESKLNFQTLAQTHVTLIPQAQNSPTVPQIQWHFKEI